jgi:hypothetical protein
MVKATKVRFISAPDVPSCLTCATFTMVCSQPEMVRAARMHFKHGVWQKGHGVLTSFART